MTNEVSAHLRMMTACIAPDNPISRAAAVSICHAIRRRFRPVDMVRRHRARRQIGMYRNTFKRFRFGPVRGWHVYDLLTYSRDDRQRQ